MTDQLHEAAENSASESNGCNLYQQRKVQHIAGFLAGAQWREKRDAGKIGIAIAALKSVTQVDDRNRPYIGRVYEALRELSGEV